MSFAALPLAASSPSSWSWSGVYVGGQVGGGWGLTDWNSATGFLNALSSKGFAGSGIANGFAFGGQVGANYLSMALGRLAGLPRPQEHPAHRTLH